MAKKVTYTKEAWARLKKLSVVFIPVRGIAHKSASVASGKPFKAAKHLRHIASKKVIRDGSTNRERVVMGRR